MLSEGIASPHRKRGSLTTARTAQVTHGNHSPHRNDPAHLRDFGSELGELAAALLELDHAPCVSGRVTQRDGWSPNTPQKGDPVMPIMQLISATRSGSMT